MLFWGIGSFFAFLAAAVLLLWPADTERLFAWTINAPVTAHFIGACFLSVSVMSLLSTRVETWAAVRSAFFGTLSFVTAMTVATLIHLDLFHLDSDEPVALVSAWGWLAVYLAAPVTSAALVRLQLRRPGTDPAPRTPIPPLLRALLAVQAAVLVVGAAALFLAPGRVGDVWPWALTPLTARAIASFLLGFGVILAGLPLENARDQLAPPMAGCAVLSVLAGAAVARFDEFVSGGPEVVAYFVLFSSVLLAAGWGLVATRSAAQGSSTV